MTQLSYFKNAITPKVVKDISFDSFVNTIKTDSNLKEKTKKLRALNNKSEKSSYKKNQLPAITVSGTFDNIRRVNNLKKHSGFIQIDFDNINVSKHKEALYADKYTRVGFISPSGTGIKLVVEIAADKHKESFAALEIYYKKTYSLSIDKSVKDISRLMFLCYDSNIFENKSSSCFIVADKVQNIARTESKKPINTASQNSEYSYNVNNFSFFVEQIQAQGINIADDRDDWLNIGFALAHKFNETGRTYYHSISSMSSKYDVDKTNSKYDECIKNHNGKMKIATVFHLAINAGLKVVNKASYIKPTSNKSKKKEIDLDEISSAPVPQSENIDEDINNYGLYFENNLIYRRKKGGDECISNFCLSLLFKYTNDGNSPTWFIKWINDDQGKTNLLEVSNEKFSSLNHFNEILLSIDCVFHGTSQEFQRLKTKLLKNYYPVRTLETLGFDKKSESYVFSNAILLENGKVYYVNDQGLVNINNNFFYIPHNAKNNKENIAYEEERLFNYKRSSSTGLKDYLNLMFRAYGFTGHTAVFFLINSIMYDIVFKECGFFPYLFLFGEPGTGKTSLVNLILSVFGDGLQGVSVKGSSYKGATRKLSQYSNAITYLKEYDNDISGEFDSVLKTAYDGVGYTIAQKTTDNKNKTFKVTSGIFIDGNSMPTNDEAVFSRIILLNLRSTIFSDEQTKAFETLQKECDGKGYSRILQDIFLLRKEFKANFRSRLNKYTAEIKTEYKDSKLEARPIRHIAFILSAGSILADKKIISENEFLSFADYFIKDTIEKEKIMIELKSTTMFFQAFAEELRQHKHGLKNNEEYKLDKDGCVLNIKFDSLYMCYRDYSKRAGQNSDDKTTMKAKLTNQHYPPFITQKGKSKQKQFSDGARYHQFIIEKTKKHNLYTIEGVELFFD